MSLDSHGLKSKRQPKRERWGPPERLSLDDEMPPDAQNGASSEEKADTNADGDAADTPVQYPSRIRLVISTIGMMFAAFMVALDNYILATAIPRISSDLNSLSDVGWYASGYFLIQMAFQPVFGQIFNACSARLSFLAAIAIFEIGSIVCATAPTSVALIVGRLIAGAGGAGLYVGVLVFLGHAVPVKHRPALLSVVTSVFGIASVCGPLLGGAFTDSEKLTWRFCFWINLPIGFIAAVLVISAFKVPTDKSRVHIWLLQLTRKIDPLGVCLLIGGFVCLLLALQWAVIVFPCSDSKVWGCLLGAFLLLSLFVAVRIMQGEHGSIALYLLKRRTVAASTIFLLFVQMVIGVQISYLPLYFQAVLGSSARESGILSLPYLVTLLFAPMISGVLISLFGYYVPIMTVGTVLGTVGSGLVTSVRPDSPAAAYIGYQFSAGLGLGLTNQISYTAVQHALPPDKMVLGSALVSFANSLGPIVGIAVAQVIFASEFLQRLAFVPGLDVGLVVQAGPTALATVVPSDLLGLAREAYGYALTKAYVIAVAAAGLAVACSLFMEHKNLKAKTDTSRKN